MSGTMERIAPVPVDSVWNTQLTVRSATGSGVGVGVIVGVAVGNGVAVGKGVGVGEGIAVGSGVDVAVGSGDGVGVGSGVGVSVGAGVGVSGMRVGVGIGVAVLAGIGVGVGSGDGVDVGSGVGVGVSVGVDVGVGSVVGVGSGVKVAVGSGVGVFVGVEVAVAMGVKVLVTVKVGVNVGFGGWILDSLEMGASVGAMCVSVSAVGGVAVGSVSDSHAARIASEPLSAIAVRKGTMRRRNELCFCTKRIHIRLTISHTSLPLFVDALVVIGSDHHSAKGCFASFAVPPRAVLERPLRVSAPRDVHE